MRAVEPSVGHAAGLHAHVEALRGEGFRFLLVSRRTMLDQVDHRPYGIDLQPMAIERVHPDGWDPTAFLETFNMMNCLAFGPRGLPMPRWVLVDLIIMPSVLVVITLERDVLEGFRPAAGGSAIAALLADADKRGILGPVPVAAYCAAPSAERGRWIGWSSCSVMPDRGLGTIAKALAVGAYRADFLDGVTQFDNPALAIHTRFGALTLVSTHIPLHTARGSFVYSSDLRNASASMQRLLEKRDHGALPDGTTFLLDPEDEDRQRAMNDQLLDGTARYSILSPGWIQRGGKRLVPIREEHGSSR